MMTSVSTMGQLLKNTDHFRSVHFDEKSILAVGLKQEPGRPQRIIPTRSKPLHGKVSMHPHFI
jgi:hypothetical protein